MQRWMVLISASRAGIAMLIRAVVQVLLLILLARQLGSVSFGSWVAATSLALLVGTLGSMGVGYLVLLRSGQGRRRGSVSLAVGLPWVLWCLGPLLLLYLLLAAKLFGGQLGFVVLLAIGVAEIVLSAPTLLLALRLQGSGYPGTAQALYIVTPALRVVYLLLAQNHPEPLEIQNYSLWHGATAMVTALLAWRLCRKMGLLPSRWRWRPRWTHILAAMPYLPTRLCALGAAEIDKILAPLVLSSPIAGSYALASRAAGFLMLPVHATLASAQPRLAHLRRSNPVFFIRTCRIGLILATVYGLLAAMLFALLAPFPVNWLTGGIYPDLPTAFSILAFALVPMTLRHAAGGILLPLGKPMLRVTGEILGMAALCLALPPLSRFGLTGMGWALVISETLAMAVLLAGLRIGIKEKN